MCYITLVKCDNIIMALHILLKKIFYEKNPITNGDLNNSPHI